MTTLIGTVRDNLGEPLASGTVRFTASAVHTAGADVFVPAPVDVAVVDGVPDATADIAETDEWFRYRVEVLGPAGPGAGVVVLHRVVSAVVAGASVSVASLTESGTVVPLSVADGLQAQLDALVLTTGPAGPAGPAGPTGAGIDSGMGAPTDPAVDGGLYVDTETGDLYRWTA